MQKNAFIAIVGCPNVGKSSILNKLLGTKIAIVSSKPQTTRTKIMGVLTDGETQLVFTDTPGYHKPRNKLGEKMNKAVGDSIGGVDACLFVRLCHIASYSFSTISSYRSVGYSPVKQAWQGSAQPKQASRVDSGLR